MRTDKECVNWTAENGVATITISNPPVNALNKTVRRDFTECLGEITADDSILVIIVTGVGRAFMAGADIKELPQFRIPGVSAELRKEPHRLMGALEQMKPVTIAAINGLALGGGCELALACDMRVASEDAQLGLPEIKLGLLPGGGGTQRLPRLVGKAIAKELMFTGEPISAQEAYRIGLVNRVAPVGQALSVAQEMAEKISNKSGAILRLIKEAVDNGCCASLDEGLAVESAAFGRALETEDCAEWIDAFLNKRHPQFKHR